MTSHPFIKAKYPNPEYWAVANKTDTRFFVATGHTDSFTF
jgi:hypothetical protein